MAGILANSASATMVAGDTAVDKSVSGYMAKERVTLTVTGSPSTVLWGLSKPTASGSVSALDSTTSQSCAFTPDVEGYYVITCLIDGATSYVLRLAASQTVMISTLSTARLLPVAEANVPTPPTGATLFYSIDQDALAAKLADGTVVLL